MSPATDLHSLPLRQRETAKIVRYHGGAEHKADGDGATQHILTLHEVPSSASQACILCAFVPGVPLGLGIVDRHPKGLQPTRF
jgi:hypothetical protein